MRRAPILAAQTPSASSARAIAASLSRPGADQPLRRAARCARRHRPRGSRWRWAWRSAGGNYWCRDQARHSTAPRRRDPSRPPPPRRGPLLPCMEGPCGLPWIFLSWVFLPWPPLPLRRHHGTRFRPSRASSSRTTRSPASPRAGLWVSSTIMDIRVWRATAQAASHPGGRICSPHLVFKCSSPCARRNGRRWHWTQGGSFRVCRRRRPSSACPCRPALRQRSDPWCAAQRQHPSRPPTAALSA